MDNVETCRLKTAFLKEKDHSFRSGDRYPNFDENPAYAALQREHVDAHLALGHALLHSGPLTQERLIELNNAFRTATSYYDMIEDLFDIGDDRAEALYQQSRVFESLARIQGSSYSWMIDDFYSKAVKSATRKKLYYQEEWDKARGSKGTAKGEQNISRFSKEEEEICWQFLEADSLDIHDVIHGHEDFFFNVRSINCIEWILTSNRKRVGNKFERAQAKLQLLKNYQSPGFAYSPPNNENSPWNQYLAFTERYARSHSDELDKQRRDCFAQQLAKLGFTLRSVGGVEVILPPVRNIPTGEFLMGSDLLQDRQADADEMPQHRVLLPAYQIATFPVTVAEYACFVRAGGQEPQPERGLVNWAMQQQQPDRPVICVSWYQANAYAGWLAKLTGQPWRLPTEAEWEKAARWDQTRQHARIYPWGDRFEKERCRNKEAGIRGFAAVGTYPNGASSYGVQEMAGNVYEWTSSLLKPYPYDQKDGREQADAPGNRVLRGGSLSEPQKYVRTAFRQSAGTGFVNAGNGFRLMCALHAS